MDENIKNKILNRISRLLKSNKQKQKIEKSPSSQKTIISSFDDLEISVPKEPTKKEYNLPDVELINNSELKKMIKSIKEKKDNLYIPIGSSDGNMIIEKIKTLPNLLIGGTIMSGKTTYINSIITTQLFTKKPNELKLLIYDSKGIDYSEYNDIPHLLSPIIKNELMFKKTIEKIEYEVSRRYKILESNNCKNITEYNACTSENNAIPDILIIIDDYISLSQNENINKSIEYISKNGWNANVFIIVVANHPSSRIIPTVSKTNFPARLSFKVISKKDSIMILDEPGAEKLGELGTAIYKSNYSNEMKKVKIPIYSEDEIKAAINYAKSQQTEQYNIINDEKMKSRETFTEEEPLYNEIVEFVVTSGKASASLLQRRFHLGYNRAARCIDLLEKRGIIGPNNGSIPREVLVKLEEYDK